MKQAEPEERSRRVRKEVRERRCGWCAVWFEFQQPTARYCSDVCRQLAYQRRKAEGAGR
jgi:hypothetical protein